MTDLQGMVQEALDDLVEGGIERGLQVAVYHDGALIADAWSGTADSLTGKPVGGDTLFTVFSTSKGITATVIHLLVARGLLEYDQPIARYWPEFGARGKELITLRQALAHTAGIPQLPDGVGPAELCDWDSMCRGIEALTPLWAPGTRVGYHAFTYGWILGETARRVDGRSFARIVSEDIAGPLGLDGLFFGLPESAASRIATLEEAAPPPPPPAPAPDDLSIEAVGLRALPPHLLPLGPVFNRADVRQACIPAGGALMNARSIAGHYAGLIGALPDGSFLLPEAILKESTRPHSEEIADGVVTGRWGLGYALGLPAGAVGPLPTTFGHGGYGGSVGFADPVHRIAFGLTKTWLETSVVPVGEETAVRIRRAVYETLGIA